MSQDLKEFIAMALCFLLGAQVPILINLYIAYEAWQFVR